MKKEYKLQNGQTAVFEYDENGIGKITVEAMDYLIEMLPKWIPCSERLPEKSGKYLVSCKANSYSNITTAANWQNRYKHWDMTGARSHWRVDAWMPLPEPYKEEK